MGPSESQLRQLSPQDRILYKKWFRRGLLLYSSLMAALVFAAVANHVPVRYGGRTGAYGCDNCEKIDAKK